MLLSPSLHMTASHIAWRVSLASLMLNMLLFYETQGVSLLGVTQIDRVVEAVEETLKVRHNITGTCHSERCMA